MYLLQTIYPFALASLNMAMGWLLYNLSEPVFGGLLVMTGVLVILISVGSTVNEYRPVLRKSA